MKTLNHPSIFKRGKLLAAFGAVLLSGGLVLSAKAANLGHSRLVSAYGQALRINIPVTNLSVPEASTFIATPAAASEWAKAGLTPPVEPDSMQINLVEGYSKGAYILQISSNQLFNKPIADLLLDVKTSSGVQRYQVSIIAQVSSTSVQAPVTSDSSSVVQGNTANAASAKVIQVRKGDTMFAIAQRHAVPDVSVYQLMVALLRANPQAFIQGNLNLVKAGSSLEFPNSSALNAISDSEARKIFHQHLLAFEQQRRAPDSETNAASINSLVPEADAVSSLPESNSQESASNVTAAEHTGDQLKLSSAESTKTASTTNIAEQNLTSGAGVAHAATVQEGSEASDNTAQSDDTIATTKAIGDAKERVSQLEENVKKLNQALQSQGEAAKDIVIDGAKGLKDSFNEVASAVAEATGLDDNEPNTSKADQGVAINANSSSQPAAANQNVAKEEVSVNTEVDTKPKSTAGKINHWVKNNLIATIAGMLAFFVALIAWLLLRTNKQQSLAYKSVTPEMVQEKLSKINLDLNEPSLKDPSKE